MIPILFPSDATKFTTNGLGRLSDVIECIVTEERNGPYELEMRYPITGRHYSDISISRIICAVPADGKALQPFRIYRMEKPLNGVVTVYAEHISYQLNHIPVMPFTATSCQEALLRMVANSAQENPFSVWTDKTTTGNFKLDHPEEFRALLGGMQGSILDVYGKGEYEFDGYTVKLHVNRGANTGVVLRYGKNITDLTQDENIETTITGVCPYWEGEDGTVVTLPEYAVWAETAENFPYKRTAVIDFSEDWEEAPTVAQLRARANKYITDNDIGIPRVSLDVEFVPLWQTGGVSPGTPTRTLVLPASVDGDTAVNVNGTVSGDTLTLTGASWEITYDDYKVLERVNLCDTLTVRYDALGVDATAKIVRTEYNVLKERYDALEIGDARTTLADQIVSLDDEFDSVNRKIDGEVGALQAYVNHQTDLITGGLGGYVVMNLNADGQPEEILIMDTDDMATAVNVIRMNKNGIGFSTNGYSGPFTSAWTIDGVFNASFIGAGTMTANLIKAGILSDNAGKNYWNMQTGEFSLASTATVGGSTVSTIANNAAKSAVDGQTQLSIFNKLTNNGQTQGIYLSNGKLYINADYVNTGTFTANRISGGTLTDTSGNNTWNLTSGLVNFKNFAWTATNSSMTSAGVLTCTNANISGNIVVKGDTSQCTVGTDTVYAYRQLTGLGDYTRECLNFSVGTGTTRKAQHSFVYYDNALNDTSISVGTYMYRILALTNQTYIPAIETSSDLAKLCYAVETFSRNSTNGGTYKIEIANGWMYSLSDASFSFNKNGGTLNGKTISVASSSSKRYKHDIQPLEDAHNLLKLEPKTFVYNEGHPLQYADMEGQRLPGFIAEDVAEVYPSAVIHRDGEIESWDERRIIPGMLKLIQEQQEKINELETRLKKLEDYIGGMVADGK